MSDVVFPQCQVEVLTNTALRVKLDTHRSYPKSRERRRDCRLPSPYSLPLASAATSSISIPVGLDNPNSSTGRDLELIDIAEECLLQSGRPTVVKPGKDMF